MTSVEKTRNVILVLATLLISVTIQITQLEMSDALYKTEFSNCDLATALVQVLAPTLASCALICTKSATCQAVALREGECALMSQCPTCCNPTSVQSDGWSVYCQQRLSMSLAINESCM